ncbi:MAG: hypothetical protein K2M57_03070, partial [Paramuribaculum sp.]|nr:hypothetical protein [Paramuribaculum sp.]
MAVRTVEQLEAAEAKNRAKAAQNMWECFMEILTESRVIIFCFSKITVNYADMFGIKRTVES